MRPHNHDLERVTFGCPGCIDEREWSEWVGSLRDWSDDQIEEYILDHEHAPDRRFDAVEAEELRRRQRYSETTPTQLRLA